MKTQIWFLLSLILISSQSFASWSLTTGAGAYMGEAYVGAAYTSKNEKHLTELTYGKTNGDYAPDAEQFNLQYVFSPFDLQIGKAHTNILGLGLIVSRWNSSSGFVFTPDHYPEDNYYPTNRYRASLLFSHAWTFKKLSLLINWALLDQTAIALYNNPDYWDQKEIWSSGFGLRWSW